MPICCLAERSNACPNNARQKSITTLHLYLDCRSLNPGTSILAIRQAESAWEGYLPGEECGGCALSSGRHGSFEQHNKAALS
jgi:hypothetical protein